MSDLRIQYLAVKAKAARLRQRFQENNPGENIERSETFLAEDWQICAEKMAKLTTAMFKEYAHTRRYPYVDCKPQLRPGHWRHSPRLRKTERYHDFDAA
jgi:hypothetical protein